MYSSQITQILRANPMTSKIFEGCFPCDLLPSLKKCPTALIVNLDPHEKQGSHWITLYVEKDQIFYFDSLALPVSSCIVKSFLKNFKIVKRNVRLYQSPLSKTCAHHCISLIYYLSQGYSIFKYITLLDSINNTDLFVTKIVNNMINN